MRTVTLLQLRTDIAAQCDFSTSASGRYPPSILNRMINQSIQRFRERISNEGMTHFLVSAAGALPAGPTSTFAFQTLDLSSLSPSVVRTYGIDITVAGVVTSLAHRPFQERNDFTSSPTMTGQPRAWAHFQTTSVAIMPAPDTAYPYTVWYLPVLADLSADGDTFDGVAGWEVWVMWDCVCQLIARDQYATAYTQAIAERDLAWTDIVRSATKVSSAGGAVVGRDTMGQAGLWGRQPLRVVGAISGSAGVSANTLLGSPLEAGEFETTNVDGTTPIGFSWQKRRFWITPNIDLTGANDATAAIIAAANQRTGACVYLPEGKIRVGTSSGASDIFDLSSLPKGTTITGPDRGQKSGHRLYNDGNPVVGATLYVYGTGRLFVSGEQKCFTNLELYYPNQVKTGTPTVYGYAFDLTGHGCSVLNVTVVNPYDFLRCGGQVGGCEVDNIWGFPLHRGVYLGRVTDVARISRCNFNPAADWESAIGSGSTLPTWVAANGVHFLVDGAEAFQFHECFTYGAAIGLSSNDEDGDLFRGAGGKWEGGGFDQCTTSVRFTRGMWQGLTMTDASFAPPTGQYCILFEDTTVPGAQWERAKLSLIGARTAGVHYQTVSMAPGAYGMAQVIGGQFFGGPSSAHFANNSVNAQILGSNFFWDSNYTLSTGTVELHSYMSGAGVYVP